MILTGTGTIQSEFLPPLLDAFPTAAGAYSLRKLRTAYTGAAVRVRRSSDNAELDIGFDANGDFDTASLQSFIGVSNGRIRTWYDQSGNNRNFGNTVTTTQPVIADTGVINTYNNRPMISFANYGLIGATQFFTSADMYASCVLKSNSTASQRGLMTSRAAGTDNSPAMTLANGNAPSIAQAAGGCGAFSDSNQMTFSAQWDSAVASYLWKNSVLQSGPCNNPAYTNTSAQTVMGANRQGDAYTLQAYVFEMVLWHSLQADNRASTSIEANQAKYYSIGT